MKVKLPVEVGTRPPGLLDEWVAAGLMTPDQAAAIRSYEANRPGAPGTSLVVEALGYIGGVIMLTGAGILVGLLWDDLPVAVRLALVGLTALALVAAGLAVPDRLGEAAGRLRSVLWVLAVAATAGFLTVLSVDVLDRYDEDALLVVFPPTAVVAAALWWMRRTWPQQLALLVSLAMSATAVGVQVTDSESAPGLAVWTLAVAWTAVAWTGWIQPRATGVAFGGLAAIFGAMTTGWDLGIVLGLVTAVVLLALALLERSLPLLAVAALGMLQAAPRAAIEWFPGRLSASLTLIVVGGLLVAAAVWVARHQHHGERPAT
ncbi:DUF2157 domain-containing protein [Nocardioides dilutus]